MSYSFEQNPDLGQIHMIQKWIEVLKSGKYKQGKGRLREGDKFCCLGVLCDMLGENNWSGDLFSCLIYDVPLCVRDEVGFGLYLLDSDSGDSLSLVDANDVIGMSFDEIADILSSAVDEWFKLNNQNGEFVK